MRIYLDVCCLNRPLDDLTIDRNRLEAEAVVAILHHVSLGDWEWIGSEAIERELGDCRDAGRRRAVQALMGSQTESISVDQSRYDRMRELMKIGFDRMDALHIACAEAAACDILLTTDDRLLRKAGRHRSRLGVDLENPVTWLMGQTP